ncbi:MAG: transglycosylase domain-containing protein [Chthoniobacterales bacterium]
MGLIVGVVGLIAFGILKGKYEARAAEFDLDGIKKMEGASLIYGTKGKQIGKLFIQNRNPVPYEQISPWLVKAVIAAEDNRFYEHKGVDWMGVVRAAITNYRSGRIRQGASTVTQQLARNSFDMRERTFERKFVEMFLAMRVEKAYTKDEIMEHYLNRVYFGSGFYGAEAASRGYFHKSAKHLNPGEAAMLAGLLKSPQALSPWNNYERAVEARDFVLRRMRDQGFISRSELAAELATKLLVYPRQNPHKVSYAIEMIRQQVISALGFDRAMNGGLRIYTTLDSDLQSTAEKAMQEELREVEDRPDYKHQTYAEYRQKFSTIEDRVNQSDPTAKMPEPRYLQGAVVVLDNKTGGVRAIVGGRNYRHSEYNRAVQSKRPSGTTFTPFLYAAAYDNGIFPGTIVDDACIDNRYVMIGGSTGILGEWGVERADNTYEGPMTTRLALVKGKNAATVRLGLQLGLEKFRESVKKMGITSDVRDYTNAFLGTSELSLEELTLGFTNFPNLGKHPSKTYIVERILAPHSEEVLYAAQPELVSGIHPEAAYQTHAALSDIMTVGMGSDAYRKYGLGSIPTGGKAGTAYNFTDTFFVGYTSEVTCGVWVGFDRPTRIFRGAFGSDLALPVWAKVIKQASNDFPAKPISRPTSLEPVEICSVSGLLATSKCIETDGEGHKHSSAYIELATQDEKPTIRCDVHSVGIRSYAKKYEEEEWPRAAAAIDLSRIRPVAIQAPTLLGLTDVYHSVRPGAAKLLDEGALPVARAVAVNLEGEEQTTTEDGVPVAAAVAVDAGTNGGEEAPAISLGPDGEPVVRAAEQAATTRLIESPVLSVDAPAPVDF